MNERTYRKAIVRFHDQPCGCLMETEHGYRFVYDEDFVRTGRAISASLPLRKEPYESKELFSFFRGLLPEGWYLDIISKTAKIDVGDSFGILMLTAADTVGAVSVGKPEGEHGV